MSEGSGRSTVDLNGCHSNNLKKEGDWRSLVSSALSQTPNYALAFFHLPYFFIVEVSGWMQHRGWEQGRRKRGWQGERRREGGWKRERVGEIDQSSLCALRLTATLRDNVTEEEESRNFISPPLCLLTLKGKHLTSPAMEDGTVPTQTGDHFSCANYFNIQCLLCKKKKIEAIVCKFWVYFNDIFFFFSSSFSFFSLSDLV